MEMKEEKQTNEEEVEPLTKRRLKYGASALVAILALLGILIIINVIADHESIRWDSTKAGLYTLSDQTKKALKNLKKDVNVLAFFTANSTNKVQAEDLLNEYKVTSGKIKVEFVDPNNKPALAKQYNVTRDETIVFVQDDKKEIVTNVGEAEFTGAILKLSKRETKKIYFITGHGEEDVDSGDQNGYAQIKDIIEKEGFETQKLLLPATAEMPKDISILIEAGPKTVIMDREKEMIEKYLNEGGKALFLLDPKVEEPYELGFSDILKQWGAFLKQGIIVDPDSYLVYGGTGSISIPMVQKYESHQITTNLPATAYPLAQGIFTLGKAPEGVTVTPIIKSSSGSWQETNLKETSNVQFNPETDTKGPINIGVFFTHSDKKTRIVAIGNSTFANNTFLNIDGNIDLFMNSLHWLVQEEELISIRPKTTGQTTVELTNVQTNTIFYSTVIGIPVACIISGITVWVSRRRRKTNV